MSITEHVQAARKAATQMRRLEDGGMSNGASINAHQRHLYRFTAAMNALNDAGRTDLTGWITEEDALVRRIKDSKTARPELSARLKGARSALRSAEHTVTTRR